MKKGCLNWSVEQLANMKNTACTECHESVRQDANILYTVNAGGSGGFEVIVCANCGNIFTYWDQDLNLQEFGFIIADIKKIRSTPLLFLPVIVLLPFAVIIEALAAMCNRGGVIRCYGIRNNTKME